MAGLIISDLMMPEIEKVKSQVEEGISDSRFGIEEPAHEMNMSSPRPENHPKKASEL